MATCVRCGGSSSLRMAHVCAFCVQGVRRKEYAKGWIALLTTSCLRTGELAFAMTTNNGVRFTSSRVQSATFPTRRNTAP